MGITLHPWCSGDGGAGDVAAESRALRRLHRNLLAVVARGDAFTEAFYARLFRRRPELRPLFAHGLEEAGCRLRAKLALLTSPVADAAEVACEIARLGRLHAALGLREADYALAAACLVESLAEVSGASWSEELEREWTLALRALCSSMERAGRKG